LTALDLRISVTHVPGVNNTTADALSRLDRAGDYALKMEVYRQGVEFLGTMPTLDLFASDLNHKCERYLALPGPMGQGAIEWDALRFSFPNERPYAFPPVQLIPRVLQKLRLEGTEAVVVVPEWPSRPWWNLLQQGVIGQVRLGKSEEVLEPGPWLLANGNRLPPGNMIMAKVYYGW
jgi:hypothetical protein